MKCPKCGKQMINKGNLRGMVYTSNPPQWDDVYVCENCKIKKTVRVYGENLINQNYNNFKEI